MSRERLLKRIRAWSQRESSAGNDLAAFTESVLNDVETVLNTRQGTVILDPDFGMPDFSNLFNSLSPPELENLQRSLRSCLEHSDRRLQGVSVEYVPRDNDIGVLRFSISARLQFRNQEVPMNFFSLLQGDGSIGVQT
jgi:type VI secretion system protein